MGSVMMRHDRARKGLGVLLGLTLPIALTAPGCLRTLDDSLIGQNQSDGGGASGGTSGSGGNGGSSGVSGTGGSAGADASTGGSAGDGGGGTSGSGGAAGGGGSGGLPDAGFTAYDPVAHPGKDLFHVTSLGLPIVMAADNLDVFQVKKADSSGGTIISTPLDGSASTPVTGADVTRALALAAPTGSLFAYYVGGTAGIGEIGRYLKDPQGSPNPKVPITPDAAIEQGVAVTNGNDSYAYMTAVAVAKSPTVLRFSLGAGGTTADTLYTSTTGGEQSGDITASGGCVYWISNGAIWVIPNTGAIVRKSALATPITDAVGLASDSKNFYYTRSNGEVWQRALSPSPACDGSGAPEKPIAGGFTNIGDVIAYAPDTVAWAAKGDSANSFAGGGIFTTAVGGYDVVQIAPETDGVEQISDAGTYVVYVTTTGFIRRVQK